MEVKIKRFDKSLPLPEYKTPGAVGFDLYVKNDETIKSHEVKLLKANIGIKAPKNYFLQITGRSSTPAKFGLLVFTGIIDHDFCGDEDELKISVFNFTKSDVKILAGTRIAQGIFVKISKVEFKEVTKMSSKSRGGFGTTGHN